MIENLNNIIESLLFAAEEPLTIKTLQTILETVEAKEIRSALETLAEHYESRGGGFKLVEVAGGWQLRSRPEYNQWLKLMLQPPPQRLSKAALETLAIIAYNQPIIRADIEHIRGVDAGGVLRQLLERKLIRVLGRKEIPGRPLIYATTKLFLELFELKDLKDLPSPKEIEDMMATIEGTPNAPQLEPEQGENADPMTFDTIYDSSTTDDHTPPVHTIPVHIRAVEPPRPHSAFADDPKVYQFRKKTRLPASGTALPRHHPTLPGGPTKITTKPSELSVAITPKAPCPKK